MIPPLSILYRPGPVFRTVDREVVAAYKEGRLALDRCVVCGAMPTHGHHADYSKPLSVVFLCPRHHTQLHHRLKRRFHELQPRRYTQVFHDQVLAELRRNYQEPALFHFNQEASQCH
jgi:hypothetical protein